MPTTNNAVTGDPIVAFNFALEISGMITGFFTSVSGLGDSSEVTEHKIVDSAGRDITLKLAGRATVGEITLKRGITAEMDAWKWRQIVEDGRVSDARRSGSIIMYSQEGKEVARWDIENAWPSKIETDGLDSSGNSVVSESITIVYEGLERVL